MLDATVLVLAFLLLLTGALGCFLPVVPGVPLIFAVFLGYGLYDGWRAYGLAAMIVCGALAAFSVVIDNIAGAYGAKAFGSGKSGMIGAIIGAIAGVIFFSIPGLILGTFIGAALFEMVFSGKELKRAAKAGAGALLGCLAGSFFKFMLSAVLIVAFAWLVFTAGPK
jgi:uncharacterized protein YqgC (DUF456 family)